ncbi:uncharacterized protein LOC131663978 [Phymastichus coffea]|uniref:uncharacterized protein LOC131663978 n=1 Tax=Phymastichus coffea TaxID=108790 RepID=UPI00273A9F92|nr:uncharacterized protein LOC131663978 [Phymastichus coffea]
MKVFASLLLLAVLAILVVDAYVPPVKKPHPNVPKFPTFPGQGSFTPFSYRIRRSPQNNGQISVNGKKEGGQTSWNVEGQKKVWGNDHGSIHISGGANKQPGGKPQGQIGIGGEFQWG